MRRCRPEIEQSVPKIPADKFNQELSARENEVGGDTLEAMMELWGEWMLVGWAFSDDVQPRDLCTYVIMCKHPDGRQYWCHTNHYSFEKSVGIIKKNPKKLARD